MVKEGRDATHFGIGGSSVCAMDVIPVGFVDHNRVGHLHDATFDTL